MKALFPAVVVFCGMFIGVNTVFSQGLTFATNTVNPTNSSCYMVVSADINGDGKMDLIIGSDVYRGRLILLTNNGSGGFGMIDVGLPPSDNYNRVGAPIAVVDLNGDGKQEMIVGDYSAEPNPRGPGEVVLTVVTNNGGSNFIAQVINYSNPGAPLSSPGKASLSWILATNVNRNGKPDVIIVNYTVPGYLTVLTNGGTNFFNVQTNYIVGRQPTCVVAADVNGDGHPDLICANAGDQTITVLTNDGSGSFGSNATLNVGGSPNFIAAADVNGDGYVDLISANTSTNTLTILTNNGYGVFGSNATLVAGAQPSGIVAADINGDGYVDLINANYADHTLTIFTNNGSGIFGSNATLNVGNGPWGVAATDLNGDGKLDLATANYFGATVSVLIQTNVSPPMLNITSASSNSVAVSWSLPGYEPAPSLALQTNADLTTTNWGLADYLIATNGPTETVTINPSPSGNLFFRLLSQ